ncbi:MAG: queuosine precursor transporter [Candidatus Hodarchaeota archaeon]
MLEGLLVSIGVFIMLGPITYIGAWYTAKYDSPRALIGIYILFLTLAQFLAAKSQASFDFGLIILTAPAGVLVFPFTMQITDMVNEKFGRRAVYEMIWIAFISQILMIFFLYFAIFLPVAGEASDPLVAFTIVPSITLASWISFFISERFDAWIYDQIREWIQRKIEGRKQWWKFLWIRNIFSDILSLGLDSLLFVPLAFLILPSIHQAIDPAFPIIIILPITAVIEIIIGQLGTKWILGVIDTPFMYLTRWIYEKESPTTE